MQITATTSRNAVVGQPLSINCALNITLRNITIDANLRLKRDGVPIHYWNVRTIGASFTKSTSVVTWRNHTISELNTNHDGKTYLCEGIINTAPSLYITSSLFLRVAGKFSQYLCTYRHAQGKAKCACKFPIIIYSYI